MDTTCVAICSNGERCTVKRKAIGNGMRCGVHHNTLLLHGPNTLALMELKYLHYRNNRNIHTDYMRDIDLAVTQEAKLHIYQVHSANLRNLQTTYYRDARALKQTHEDEIIRTGVNPDAAANQRRQQKEDQRRQRVADRQELIRQDIARQIQEQAERGNPNFIRHNIAVQNQNMPAPPAVVRRLGAFAADPQNVHTVEAVRQTKEIVEKVRTVSVPEEYKWNTLFVSKTIGEIITECKLTSHAAAQMFNQYVSPVAIYDIEEGIYGKVLDSVWQFVKASPDKEDLCKILKQEMTDNINMCAQGNLSRICNILAGYMEGIGSQETLSERLGRLLPPLMAIEDCLTRIMDAIKILKDNNVPMTDWDKWLDPLKEDDEDMMIDIEFIKQEVMA
uniref:Uncharacterized protein n=1 Tax=viral metagenome TaxID=1070528 RepID=A0A6C0EUG7_9ZZZZ